MEMNFTTVAEEMHAAAAELNEFYDSLREEAWEHQEASVMGDDCSEFDGDECVGEDDGEPRCHDMSDDAEALASAGYGTDEDYGYFGGDDY